ncbi:FAD:protein FMN transferase [Verrucomicrobiales bacterium BCK34]|nr:FAD:protein FMN transferase [Verrucomicrobiales bacterium BCK34]
MLLSYFTTLPMRISRITPRPLYPCIIAASLFMSSCRGDEWELHTVREPHMGTEFTIRAWAKQGQADDLTLLIGKAFDRVAELNQICSDYLPDSEINQFAKSPSRYPIEVSDDLFDLFAIAGELHSESGGAFDITAGPLIRLWRMTRKNRRMPTREQLSSAKERTGFQNLELDERNKTITKKIDGMLFDLGGIAKGYAADEALEILRDGGFPRALVAASGDIVVGEAPPNEEGWKVGIETLELDTELKNLQVVVLENQAISTSGDTRQYVELNGARYSHIVSTKTGLGLTERIGASVIAPNAVTSDTHATIVTLLGEKEGLQFIRNKRGVECQIAVIIDDQEVFTRTDGFLRQVRQKVEKEGPFPAP